MSRIAILCPGRGSYIKKTRGLIPIDHPFLARAEKVRAEYGLPSLLELDRVADWSPALQVRPDHAAPLIWLSSMIDADQAMREHDVVCVGGNSLGWYTALAVSGVLDFEDGFRLVQEMAVLQMEHDDGGQILMPVVDEQWRADPALEAAVADALHATGAATFPSIRLGGYTVLAGTEEGVRALLDHLPLVERGPVAYPIRLAQHGPYHTPLLEPTARKARELLDRLRFQKPRVPLIDGKGRRHTPWSADPLEIRDYTLGKQITTPFDFSATVRVALREFAPDLLCLPGPGNTLGSIVAQVAIAEGWRGLHARNDFERLQESESALVWSMRR